uniref:LIM zinc-binding domain-containing protein n=1 Tax=Anopheles atroparvus TaxID=41427 RepID=A0AAG5D8I0_ANOAO
MVPKSSNVKQYCEPSFSTVLEGQASNLDEHAYTNVASAERNGTAVPGGKLGARKVTLDDALELQHVKEALEHHKRTLEANRAKSHQAGSDGCGTTVYENTHAPPYGGGYASDATYSNIPGGARGGQPVMKNNDGLIYSNIMHSNNGAPITMNALSLEDNDDEFPPPPSPVSSSYSELRRATDPPSHIGRQPQPTNMAPGSQIYANNMHHQSLYGTYGMSSQGSTTYESIYEPINPRPPSQMSARSNYSLYAPYVNSHGINSSNDSIITSASQQQHRGGGGPTMNKETEVDTLTDLLVQSIQDTDSFGTCVKCGERVVGEKTGCTAMDKIYHIACFTCQQCQINLQGKPFYALDGKPYCEEDYLNTLEKCSVCLKPILERILRATGKPYHPQCFTCIVCGKSLDGIPFTVDATNQIHCIDDFHKKFAPRCCVCKLPIMPEPGEDETVRVVALDRSFHINCYKCEDCGLLLSSEAEGRGCYPLDDHILCKSCNAKQRGLSIQHDMRDLLS